MSAIACRSCGELNDLDDVVVNGEVRVLRCTACGATDWWTIARRFDPPDDHSIWTAPTSA